MIVDDAGLNYPGIGRCIYCGSTDGLSREHIIPYGLFGNITILNASCKECSKETHAFEGACLSKMFGDLRNSLQMPSRRRKSKAKDGVYAVLINGSFKEVSIPYLAGPPAVVLFPNFNAPGIITGDRPSELVKDFTISCITIGPDKEAISNYLSHVDKPFASIRASGAIPLGSFMRLLAKIAHGLATAELGQNSFRAFLPDYILGRNKNLSCLVGGREEVISAATPGDCEHAWDLSAEMKDGQWYVTATIQLFRNLGFPAYGVIVGEASPDLVERLIGLDPRSSG